MPLQIVPEAISLSHSPVPLSRHIIVKSMRDCLLCIVPPKRAPGFVTLSAPLGAQTESNGRLVVSVGREERLVFRVNYDPSFSSIQPVIEDAIIIFNSLSSKPFIIKLSIGPVGTPRSSRISSRFMSSLDLSIPIELKKNDIRRSLNQSALSNNYESSLISDSSVDESINVSAIPLQSDHESESSDCDSSDKENVTFIEGSGWINDYGEIVRPPSRDHSSKKQPPCVSHQEMRTNWESLKRSYN